MASLALRRLMSIILGTTYVLMDEPCLSLSEINLQSPGNKGFHRYRIIRVIREGDKVADYRKDLGKVKKFKGVDQFRIPGGVIDDKGKIDIVHTVGELIDLANSVRGNQLFDKRELVKSDNIKV